MLGDISGLEKIYIVCGYTDMRKSIDGLCAIIEDQLKMDPSSSALFLFCFLQALFPQKCRLNSSKLHGEFPHYCISSAGTLSGAGEEPLQAYKVY